MKPHLRWDDLIRKWVMRDFEMEAAWWRLYGADFPDAVPIYMRPAAAQQS